MAEAVTLKSHRRRIAAQMAGGTPVAKVAYMAFGDGGHDSTTLKAIQPSDDQTALKHEVLRKALSAIEQKDLYSVTGRGLIEANELVGVKVSEAALVDANGNLIGIKNFAPKVKESDERYEISIKLRY